MTANGLSMYNVGTSLELDGLAQATTQNNDQNDDPESSIQDDDEDEIQQRNAELKNMLATAFDDLIEDDAENLDTTGDETFYSEPPPKAGFTKAITNARPRVPSTGQGYIQDSLYSPLHDGKDFSESPNSFNNNSTTKSAPNSTKASKVRFLDIHSKPYDWEKNLDETEKGYLSSGLNSRSELELLYAARGSEIDHLGTQLHDLQHKVALLEGEKTGLSVTLQNSEQVLRDCRDENACLKDEIASLNERLLKMTDVNRDLTVKMEAADNNIISLERQILELNMFQANHRDANRQEVLFSGIQGRYEKDLRSLRDELNRLRCELDAKNESLATCERKLREVTEMHERTLMERAANLQEFNRALDQQRHLREQRDSLTSSTLLEQLSKAKEEIDRLKAERISQALSDSMAQMRIGGKERDLKQTERLVSNLEQRLEEADHKLHSYEDTVRRLQNEKQSLADQLSTMTDSNNRNASELSKLHSELDSVKELYLKVCREKDSIEDQAHQLVSERAELEAERKALIRDLEDTNRQTQETIQRHQATLEANFKAKLETAVESSVAQARLEWIKANSLDQANQGSVHVEKSMGELQCLRETMDALRHERDQLQSESVKRQQQLKLERHLLQEKFKIEKEMLTKSWEDKVSALNDKMESIQKNDEFLMATVQEKLKIEKEMLVQNWQDKVTTLTEKLDYIQKNQDIRMATVQEKFKTEKELLIKNWQDKMAALEAKLESSEKNDELMKATADAMARLRQQCESEKLLIINNYEKQINELQSNASTPIASSSVSPLGPSDWKTDVSKMKAALKSCRVSADILATLDAVVQKVELAMQRDQSASQRQAEKYRHLKHRVRDYQKYATDKLAKYKAERQRKEEHYHHVVAQMLDKVTRELQLYQAQNDRRNANVNCNPGHTQAGRDEGSSNLVQTIDDLQTRVNQYLLGLSNFNK